MTKSNPPTGISIHEALDALINEAPTPGEARKQIEDIIVSALAGLTVLDDLPTRPAIFYLGSDGKVYRLDDPKCKFEEFREAALADGLIVTARSVTVNNLIGLRPSRDSLRREPVDPPSKPAPEIKVRHGKDTDWARVEEGEIRVGYLMEDGRFSYTDDKGRRRVTTEWYGPQVSRVFARITDKKDPNHLRVVEGYIHHPGPDMTAQLDYEGFSSLHFEILVDNR